MIYTHRNGEATPPTESGDYFCLGKVETPELMRELSDLLKTAILDDGALLVRLPESDGYATVNRQASIFPLGKWQCRWWGPIVPPWEVLPGNPPGAVAVSVPSESIGQCLLWINNAMGITGMASDPDLAADVAKVEAWLGQQKGDGDDNH